VLKMRSSLAFALLALLTAGCGGVPTADDAGAWKCRGYGNEQIGWTCCSSDMADPQYCGGGTDGGAQ
jgi:hypothetical protein